MFGVHGFRSFKVWGSGARDQGLGAKVRRLGMRLYLNRGPWFLKRVSGGKPLRRQALSA